MKTMDFDRIASSSPVNADAAKSRAGGGASFDIVIAPHIVHLDAPMRCVPVPRDTEDLTGRQVGRLKVIGLLGKLNPKKKMASWLVRCVCGRYETRKAKSIKAAAGLDHETHGMQCYECQKLAHIKRMGRSPDNR